MRKSLNLQRLVSGIKNGCAQQIQSAGRSVPSRVSGLLKTRALPQVFKEGDVKCCRRIHEHIVDGMLTTHLAVAFKERRKGITIGSLDLAWLRKHPLAGLDVLKVRRISERERPLDRVKDLHDNHFVLLMPKVLQRRDHLIWIIKQITEYNHETPTFDPLRHLMQRLSYAGSARRLCLLQTYEKLTKIDTS